MIQVLYGEKGIGKTKILLDRANSLSTQSSGKVVYIDDGNEVMTKLKYSIRFVNILDYPIHGSHELLGFICGIASQDYDLETVFIDGLTYIVKEDAADMENFFVGLAEIAKLCDVKFYVSVNGDRNKTPEYLEDYVCKIS